MEVISLKIKRILAGILAVSTVFTATACSAGGDTSTTTSVPETTTETTIDDEIENPVDISNISIDAGEEVEPATLINTNIKYASRNLSADDKIKRSLGLTIILMTVKNIVPKAR